MNEISIHVSYIFGSKQNLDIAGEYRRDRGIGSKEGKIVGLIKDQRGKANSWQLADK